MSKKVIYWAQLIILNKEDNMQSINYFINTHGIYIFIVKVLITFIIIMLLTFFSSFLLKFFKLPEGIEKIFVGGFVILGLFTGLFGIEKIIDPFHQGGIRKLFILNKYGKPQLTVWLTRYFSKRVGYECDQRLRCFDLTSGKTLKYIQMSKKYYDNDYRIYWLSDQYAWGYSKKTGIQLLDLVKPQIIAEEKEILSRNPELGNSIKLLYEDYLVDPYTHGIHVETEEKKIYRLDPDLTAKHVTKDSLTGPVTSIEITVKDNKIFQKRVNSGGDNKSIYSDKEKYKIDPNLFQKDWIFTEVKASLGKTINKKGNTLSNDSVYLLEPQFLEELNLSPIIKNKIWIAHKSAIYGEYDSLVSFVDANGNELNRINLYEVFKNKKANVLATYTQDKEVLIFVGIGHSYRVDAKGFSLIALRTDPNTGQISDKIQYF